VLQSRKNRKELEIAWKQDNRELHPYQKFHNAKKNLRGRYKQLQQDTSNLEKQISQLEQEVENLKYSVQSEAS
jgi:predicted  nucleic acid-binding Zn-ribbon protein